MHIKIAVHAPAACNFSHIILCVTCRCAVCLATCRVIDAAQMRGYAQTYQGVLLGASQCYKHSYSRGAGHIPSSKYQCYLRYKLLLRA